MAKTQRTTTLLGLTVREGNIQVRQNDLILAALWVARLMEGPAPEDLGVSAALSRLRAALKGAK